jgi:RNA-directed DNA polymerase
MMHGDGKSHSPIIPTKPPNEAGAEAKEAVEGRGLAKGKTLKCNRFRTQSRQILSNTLERIRQARTKDGSERGYHSYSSTSIDVMTQGKSRMRQFRMSGSVRGAAREGGSYRDKLNEKSAP